MFKTRYTYKGEAVMGFSEKLNELRLEAGLSQKELAEKLGVAQASINYWEKGQRTPSIIMIAIIAEYFHVSTDYLIAATEYTQQQEMLNKDNQERHHLLIHHYNTLDRIGRDALIEILASLKMLNSEGQLEAVTRIQELTELSKYSAKQVVDTMLAQ